MLNVKNNLTFTIQKSNFGRNLPIVKCSKMDEPITTTTNETGCRLTTVTAENASINNDFGIYGKYRNVSECNNDSVQYQHSFASTKVSEVKGSPSIWIILIVGFFVQWMTIGFEHSISVLYVPFVEAFGKSKAETSLIQSVFIGTLDISGFLIGLFITKVGPRIAGMFGGILVFIGVSVSFFANGIPFLIISLGLIGGIGSSIGYISSSTCVGYFFKGNNKLLALAFISVGSGVGTMVFPYVLEALSEEYGFKGCLLLSGGILANMIPCAALYKSPTNKLIPDDRTKICSLGNTNNVDETLNDTKENTTKSKPNFRSKMCKQLRGLKGNTVFIVYGIGMTIVYPICVAFLTIATDFLQKSQGFDRNATIFMFFMMNLSSTISRLLPGAIMKCIPRMSVILVQLMHTFVGAITFALFPFAMTYTHHVVLVMTLGFMSGGTGTSLQVATMKLVGVRSYATAFGILVGITGVGVTIYVPIAGYMVDVAGSYSLFFYTSTSGLFLAVFIFTLAYIMSICKTKQLHGMRRRFGVLPWKK